MRITVSGLPGSGTTSLARYLSSQLGFSLISAGEVFRHMAKDRNMDLSEFDLLAENDPSFDRLIDARQKEIAKEKDDIIIEGRLSGWMVADADLKIWLMASLQCRVERILSRDSVADLTMARALTEERERSEALRYRTYYQINIEDLSGYHIVLNSEHWGVEQLGAIVMTAMSMIR